MSGAPQVLLIRRSLSSYRLKHYHAALKQQISLLGILLSDPEAMSIPT